MSSFNHYARKAVNPGLPIEKRHYALYRRTIRQHLSRRFRFDDVPSDPQPLVAAVGFLQAEINRLREVSRALYRRRISQKVRGIRTASRADRKAAYDVWERAVLRSRESLQQQHD